MKPQTIFAVTTIWFSTAAEAQVLPSTFFDGTTLYSAEINDNGAILRSKGTTLYLGKDCDAYSPKFGQGSWAWANAGFRVVFPKSNKSIGFPRQESPVEETSLGLCRE